MDGTVVAIEASAVLALSGVLAALLRRDVSHALGAVRGGAPPAPYRLALCEGERCVLLGGVAERSRPAAQAALGREAERLRGAGLVGRLVLLDGRAGTVLAARRVWP